MLHARLPAAFLAYSFLLSAQAGKAPARLTVEEVVQLSRAGFSEDVIITKIRKNGKAFDLSTEELVELKKIGLSDNEIKFLLDPSLPYAPPPPPVPPVTNRPDAPLVPAGPVKQYPQDANTSRVPPEPGLYRVEDEAPLKIDLKLLLGAEEKGGLGPLKKGKVVSYIVGSRSKTRIKEPAPVFYLRLAEGKGIEEVVLMALDRKNDRRELEIGPSGKKQEFKAEAMRAFDSLETGPQLFRITTAKLGPGEYIFFQVGSAEPPKGSYGKGFDFGIDEPVAAPKKR
jgi:hypothetical protein